jgi:hypothetical protein
VQFPRSGQCLVQAPKVREYRSDFTLSLKKKRPRTSTSSVKMRGADVSQNDARIHVGLSTNETYDRFEVLWPGGAREQFQGGRTDRVVTLTQGTGRP